MFNKVEEGTKCLSIARIINDLLILVEIYVMMRPR